MSARKLTPAALSRYFHTVRHLRSAQLAALAWRRLVPFSRAHPADLGPARRFPVRPVFLPPLQPPGPANEFRFLNVARPIVLADMDWEGAGSPRLWCYNLHYFDWLHWPKLPDLDKRLLIDSWIERNPQGSAHAWEPYTASLRVVNWIKYFLHWRGPAELPRHWLESLALQLAWLTRNLEYHLLANHLLKNAKALFFGGAYFDGAEAERLREQGLAMLLQEAAEQVLPDGGHYERSPMYHQIVLEDYLDALSLVNALPALAGTEREALAATAERALGFLEGIVGGDGEIPLFNDAAHGIAVPAAQMIRWGREVVGGDLSPTSPSQWAPSRRGVPAVAPRYSLGAGTPACGRLEGSVEDKSPPTVICFPDTGYYGYRAGGDSLIIDCGAVGPDYQPGHAHCDTLSYELCLDGRRVIVDSGVFDYQPGGLRQYLRSTAAHNTVMVDEQEQSEVWGVFRVARRARPLRAELGDWQDGELRFVGAHDGYRRLAGGVVHEREVRMYPPREWRVIDRLQGGGAHRLASFIHLHPELRAQAAERGSVQVWRGEEPLLAIEPLGEAPIGTAAGWYCPQFGIKLRNTVLIIECKGLMPMETGYVMRRLR